MGRSDGLGYDPFSKFKKVYLNISESSNDFNERHEKGWAQVWWWCYSGRSYQGGESVVVVQAPLVQPVRNEDK